MIPSGNIIVIKHLGPHLRWPRLIACLNDYQNYCYSLTTAVSAQIWKVDSRDLLEKKKFIATDKKITFK